MKKHDIKRKSILTSYNDNRLIGCFVMFCFDAIAFIYGIYLCKKRDLPLNSLLEFFSFKHCSPFIWAFTLIGLYELITWIIYKIRCHNIVKNGQKHCGAELIDFDSILKPPSRSTYYSYKVKLPDGRIIKTEKYMFNNYYSLSQKKCTVYEYKGKFYCMNFR